MGVTAKPCRCQQGFGRLRDEGNPLQIFSIVRTAISAVPRINLTDHSGIKVALVRWAVLMLALAVVGCVGYPSQPLHTGLVETEVVAIMGHPTGRYPLPDGAQRLEFARGPAGRVTWMVDLDASGRLTQAEQVLDNPHFAQVQDGMTHDALLRLLGRPAARQREYRDKETWSWRYETNDCLWFRVTLNAEGRVMGGGAHMTDPACDERRGFDRS